MAGLRLAAYLLAAALVVALAEAAVEPPARGSNVAVLVEVDFEIPPLAYYDGRGFRPVHVAYVGEWDMAFWVEANASPHTHVEFQKSRDIHPAGGVEGKSAATRQRRSLTHLPQPDSSRTRRGAARGSSHIQLPQTRRSQSPQSQSPMDEATHQKTTR